MNVEAPREAFPLSWPAGWERTPEHNRERSRFEVGEVYARDHLLEQLKLMGATGIVLSTNLQLRRDGLPLSRQRLPDDTGVAVYWQQRVADGLAWRVMACDRWQRPWENMRAIGLSLEALRGIDRWGASDLLNRVFTGFALLPEAPAARTWREILGVTQHVSLADCEIAYRRLAREMHPDIGGSTHAMAELNGAIRQARQELRG